MFIEGEGITCEKCGRIWRLTRHSLVQREPGGIECDCGHTLHKWQGAAHFTAELIKELSEDDKAN
jgi:hypothetical protein